MIKSQSVTLLTKHKTYQRSMENYLPTGNILKALESNTMDAQILSKKKIPYSHNATQSYNSFLQKCFFPVSFIYWAFFHTLDVKKTYIYIYIRRQL